MRDDSLPARNRLSFFPQMGFFIMCFGDLNRYILRDEQNTDPLQQVLNAHTREDDHHWPWYLEDMEALGWNAQTTMTNAVRHPWGEESHRARLLMYDLCDPGPGQRPRTTGRGGGHRGNRQRHVHPDSPVGRCRSQGVGGSAHTWEASTPTWKAAICRTATTGS